MYCYLAYVFEKFIDTYLEFYGLDPCHYFSSPGLSWDVMLRMTGVKLTLTSTYLLRKDQEEEFLTFLKDMQKPIKYMNDYESKKPSKFIT